MEAIKSLKMIELKKNTRYDNILQVYDKKGEEVLTITLLDKS